MKLLLIMLKLHLTNNFKPHTQHVILIVTVAQENGILKQTL